MAKSLKEEKQQAVILERLTGLIDSNNKEHKAILDQVIKTNSRVSKLEIWKGLITGGMVIINLFVVPILSWLIYKHLNGN